MITETFETRGRPNKQNQVTFLFQHRDIEFLKGAIQNQELELYSLQQKFDKIENEVLVKDDDMKGEYLVKQEVKDNDDIKYINKLDKFHRGQLIFKYQKLRLRKGHKRDSRNSDPLQQQYNELFNEVCSLADSIHSHRHALYIKAMYEYNNNNPYKLNDPNKIKNKLEYKLFANARISYFKRLGEDAITDELTHASIWRPDLTSELNKQIQHNYDLNLIEQMERFLDDAYNNANNVGIAWCGTFWRIIEETPRRLVTPINHRQNWIDRERACGSYRRNLTR